MLALSCQVIGNVGSSTMCFLLEVRVQYLFVVSRGFGCPFVNKQCEILFVISSQ